MVVQRISLNGFKSFEKKRLIELNFPVTAFVGPNGSGKSNVADAIRWVLGEQSMKHIRATRVEDVIFAGSARKPSKGMAEVELHFDNQSNLFAVPFREVVITRRSYRNGQNEYLLNGRSVLLREVQELMAGSALGSFDLTVIGQGEIDQILIMGSEQITSLLEDASGVKPFYMKKQRIIRNLNRNSEHLLRLHDIMNELEPRLKELQRESKQAEAFIEFRNELKKLQQQWFSGQIGRIAQGIDEFTDAITAAQKKKDVFYAKIEELEAQSKVIADGLSERQEQLHSQQAKVETAQSALNSLWQEQAGLKAKIEFNASQLHSMGDVPAGDETSMVSKHADLQKRHAAVEAQCKLQEKQGIELQEQLSSAMKAYQELLKQLNEQQAAEVKRFDLSNIKTKLGELKDLYHKLTAKLFSVTKPSMDQIQRAFTEAKHIHERIEPLLDELSGGLDDKTPEADNSLDNAPKAEELYALTQELQEKLGAKVALKNRLEQERLSIAQQAQTLERELAQVRGSDSSGKQELASALQKEQQYLIVQEQQIAERITGAENLLRLEKDGLTGLFSQQAENKQLTDYKVEITRQQAELYKLRDQEQALLLQRTRLETKREDIVERARMEFGFAGELIELNMATEHKTIVLTVEEMMKLEDELYRMKARIDRIGDVNQKAPAEYDEVRQRFEWLHGHIEDIEEAARYIEKSLKAIDDHVEQLFNKVFADTQTRFSEYFELLFGGGEGRLVRTENVLLGQTEIQIKAQPPGKRMHDLNLLSGGERSLGAVALLFAILESCGTPLCVLDEVDAALDEMNVGKFCQALRRLNEHTQVIMITHNRRTMEVADCLYGTTMQDDGTTQIVSLRLQDYQKAEKAG